MRQSSVVDEDISFHLIRRKHFTIGLTMATSNFLSRFCGEPLTTSDMAGGS